MQAARLPARRGIFWLIAGFRLYRNNPPLLTAVTLGYLLGMQLPLILLPFIGPFLLPLLLPMLTLVVGNAARMAEREQMRPEGLFAHLRAQRGPLLRLGGIQLAGAIMLLLLIMLVEGGELRELNAQDPQTLAVLGRLLLLATPLLLAFWFAPFLVGWDCVAPVKAVFFSFVAAWRNWRAFLAYTAGLALVAVLAPGLLLILAGSLSPSLLNILFVVVRVLLLFVLAPVLSASVYVSYRDVFHARPGDEALPAGEGDERDEDEAGEGDAAHR